MNWINYSNLKGSHALISPSSSFRWLDYDESKLTDAVYSSLATKRGTVLHELACDLISNNIKLNKSDRHILQLELARNDIPSACMDISTAMDVLMPYVNDCIGFRMSPEVVLYYSNNCFGTTDAICFRNGYLRIHDLKTGSTPPHMEQLIFYAALFCLNYNEKPNAITTELRIYKRDEVLVHSPTPDDIKDYMDKIVEADKIVQKVFEREGRA